MRNGRWRAQLVRMGVTLHLGCYKYPDEARLAYDNAAHHLSAWGKHPPILNFPEETDGAPTDTTRKALAVLRDRFPEYEKQMKVQAGLTGLELLEREGMDAIVNIDRCRETARMAFVTSMSRIRILEAKLTAAVSENEKLLRVIAGLRAQGNTQFFQKVEGVTTPVTQVQAHLS